MGCFQPIAAQRSRERNENGKLPLVFNPSLGDGDWLEIGCGKCDGCRADQAREWAIRCYHESLCHEQSCVATLTYADTVVREDGSVSHAPKVLVKKDLQDFIKRLRHKRKFRYFACGEYGDLTKRPHFHMVIFGQDFLTEANYLQDGKYSNLVVERAWSHGNVVLDSISPEAMCYVAGYCAKKIGSSDTFSVASTVPPIGYNWFVKHHSDLMRTGMCVYDGQEFPIPKAYFRFDNGKKVTFLDGDLSIIKDERRAKMREKDFTNFQHLDNKKLFRKSVSKLRKEVI